MTRLHILFTILSTILVSGCSQQHTAHHPTHESPSTTPVNQAAVTIQNQTQPKEKPTARQIPRPPTATPEQKKCPLAYHNTSRNGIELSLVSFDDRDYQLQVADQKNGPATHWRDAHTAATANNGVAAINGGFFTPEGKPLGLVVTHGNRRGHNNKSSLGSGVFLSSAKNSAIIRRETYLKTKHSWGNIQHLLQAGPMLAENHSPISGLSKKNTRTRSFIAWDGQHHWAIGYAEPCTLSALSHALAGKAPAGFAIHSAINLDGGRSSDLWAGPKVNNGNHTHRGFLNKPVRNFLIISPK